MILLTGAAGKTGRAVLAALVKRGAKVRCLVRRPDAGELLLAMGACELALGSMSDDVALVAAMAQCESIYHIAPNVDAGEEAYGAAMLRAARSSGLRHVVYHSVLHPQIEAMPHHWAKLRVEEQILASGLPFTILRPTAYMQNILAAVQRAIDDGIYVTPYPVDARLSLIDLDDVGEVAARVLLQPGHDFATYDLVGTAPLDQSQVAAALSRALGREVVAREQSLADWDAQAVDNGLAAGARETLMRMFAAYAAQSLPGNPFVLRALLCREPTTLDAMLERSLS